MHLWWLAEAETMAQMHFQHVVLNTSSPIPCAGAAKSLGEPLEERGTCETPAAEVLLLEMARGRGYVSQLSLSLLSLVWSGIWGRIPKCLCYGIIHYVS